MRSGRKESSRGAGVTRLVSAQRVWPAVAAGLLAGAVALGTGGCKPKEQSPATPAAGAPSGPAAAPTTPPAGPTAAPVAPAVKASPTAAPTVRPTAKPAEAEKGKTPAAAPADQANIDQAAVEALGQAAGLPVPPKLADLPGGVGATLAEAIGQAAKQPSAETIGRVGCLYNAIAPDREGSDRAITCYEKAKALEPENFKWPYLLGRLFVGRGSSERAQQEFELARKLKADYAMTHAWLGELALRRESPEEAKTCFAKYLEILPEEPYGLTGLGAAELRLGNHEAGLGALRHALELAPFNGRAHNLLSGYYAAKQETVAAGREKSLAQTLPDAAPPLERDPVELDVWRSLGATDAAQQAVDRMAAVRGVASAVVICQALVADHPNNAKLLAMLAHYYHSSGRVDEAIATAEQAVAAKPDFAAGHVVLARCLLAQDRPEEALAAAERAVAADPKQGWGHQVKGMALLRLQRPAEAEPALQQAYEIQPENADFRNALIDSLLAQQKIAEAKECLTKAVARVVGAGVSTAYKVNCYQRLAEVCAQNGELDEAVTQLRNALRIDPNNGRVFENITAYLLQAGKTDDAVKFCREAMTRSPDNARYVMALGRTLVQAGRGPEALAPLNDALRLDSSLAEAHFLIGNVLRSQRKLAEAKAELQAALDIDPVASNTYVLMSEILVQENNYAAARSLLEQAVEKTRNAAVVLNSLAWILAVNPQAVADDIAQATPLAERACALVNRSNPNFLDTLAVVYAAGGRFDEAVEVEQQAIDLAKTGLIQSDPDGFAKRLEMFKKKQVYRENAAGKP